MPATKRPITKDELTATLAIILESAVNWHRLESHRLADADEPTREQRSDDAFLCKVRDLALEHLRTMVLSETKRTPKGKRSTFRASDSLHGRHFHEFRAIVRRLRTADVGAFTEALATDLADALKDELAGLEVFVDGKRATEVINTLREQSVLRPEPYVRPETSIDRAQVALAVCLNLDRAATLRRFPADELERLLDLADRRRRISIAELLEVTLPAIGIRVYKTHRLAQLIAAETRSSSETRFIRQKK